MLVNRKNVRCIAYLVLSASTLHVVKLRVQTSVITFLYDPINFNGIR